MGTTSSERLAEVPYPWWTYEQYKAWVYRDSTHEQYKAWVYEMTTARLLQWKSRKWTAAQHRAFFHGDYAKLGMWTEVLCLRLQLTWPSRSKVLMYRVKWNDIPEGEVIYYYRPHYLGKSVETILGVEARGSHDADEADADNTGDVFFKVVRVYPHRHLRRRHG